MSKVWRCHFWEGFSGNENNVSPESLMGQQNARQYFFSQQCAKYRISLHLWQSQSLHLKYQPPQRLLGMTFLWACIPFFIALHLVWRRYCIHDFLLTSLMFVFNESVCFTWTVFKNAYINNSTCILKGVILASLGLAELHLYCTNKVHKWEVWI